VTLVAAFTMAAKTQTVGVLPAIVLGVLWVPTVQGGGVRSSHAHAHAADPGRVRTAWAGVRPRLPGVAASAVLVAVAAVLLLGAPKRFNQVDAYDEVFNEILVHSPNKAADLRSLGVSPTLAYAAGSNVLSANSAATSQAYLQFRDHVTEATIIRFYLTHPLRLFGVAGDGLGAVSHWRQDYLGSYLAGSHHPPGAIEDRVGIYTAVFEGAPGVLIVVFWLAVLAIGWATARNKAFSAAERAVGRLAVVLAVGAFFELWTVMVGEGRSDMYKHMIVTNLLLALCLPFTAASAWLYVRPALRNIRAATVGPYGLEDPAGSEG
jgi:hypothetical protein